MAKFKIKIDTEALKDIQDATDWYNEQVSGLGSRFQSQVKKQINALKINPHGYEVRYANVRGVVVKKFPFLVHFVIDDQNNFIEIFAVYHTSRNPKIWQDREA